jgi:hypothetical protein
LPEFEISEIFFKMILSKDEQESNKLPYINSFSKKKGLEKEDVSKKASNKNFPTLNDVLKKK